MLLVMKITMFCPNCEPHIGGKRRADPFLIKVNYKYIYLFFNIFKGQNVIRLLTIQKNELE